MKGFNAMFRFAYANQNNAAASAMCAEAASSCTSQSSRFNCIALGAIIGELLDLDRRMRSLGDWVQTRTARLIHTEDGAPASPTGLSPLPCCSAWGPWPS